MCEIGIDKSGITVDGRLAIPGSMVSSAFSMTRNENGVSEIMVKLVTAGAVTVDVD